AGVTQVVPIAGRGSVPPGTKAIYATLSVSNPALAGAATVFPCDRSRLTLPLMTFARDEDVVNAAVVGLDAAGAVCVRTDAAADFALDVYGFAGATAPLRAISPHRVLDTRTGARAAELRRPNPGALAGARRSIEVAVAGNGPIPAGAAAVFLNITAIGRGSGSVTV